MHSDELPYDLVLDKRSPEKILDERVRDTVDAWKRAGFKATKAAKDQLRVFLRDNPQLPWDWTSEIRFGPRFADTIIGYKHRKGKYDEFHFARKVTSAKTFMKYLPQLMVQSFCRQEWSKDAYGKKSYRWTLEDMEEPYASVAFSYFPGKPKSKIVDLIFEEQTPDFFIEE